MRSSFRSAPIPVTIVRPSGERVQARVAERDGSGLLVALMFRAEVPFSPGSLDELVLEFTNQPRANPAAGHGHARGP